MATELDKVETLNRLRAAFKDHGKRGLREGDVDWLLRRADEAVRMAPMLKVCDGRCWRKGSE